MKTHVTGKFHRPTLFSHALCPSFIICKELYPCSEKTLIDKFSRLDRLRTTKCFMRAMFFEMLKPFVTRAAIFAGPVILAVALASDSDTPLISGVTVV